MYERSGLSAVRRTPRTRSSRSHASCVRTRSPVAARATSAADLPLEALVRGVAAPADRAMTPERRRILELTSSQILSVAELSAHLSAAPRRGARPRRRPRRRRVWCSSTPAPQRRRHPPRLPASRSWRVFSMAFPRSDVAAPQAPQAPQAPLGDAAPVAPITVKIVVAGGFAVGKTTFIGSISDIEPLSTEAAMTEHSRRRRRRRRRVRPQDHDDRRHGLRPHRAAGRPVALPVRHPRPGPLPLHVGRPGHGRDRRRRAGRHRPARASASTRSTTSRPGRSRSCWRSTASTGRPSTTLDDVREALAVRPETPVFYTDARSRPATKQALISLVTLAMSRMSA